MNIEKVELYEHEIDGNNIFELSTCWDDGQRTGMIIIQGSRPSHVCAQLRWLADNIERRKVAK